MYHVNRFVAHVFPLYITCLFWETGISQWFVLGLMWAYPLLGTCNHYHYRISNGFVWSKEWQQSKLGGLDCRTQNHQSEGANQIQSWNADAHWCTSFKSLILVYVFLHLSQYGGYFTESQTCQTQDQTEDEDEDEEDPEDPENPAPQIDPAQRKQDSTDRRGAGCFNMFRNIGHYKHSLTPHHPSIIQASSEHLHQLWPPRLVSDVWLFDLELMDGCGTKTFNHWISVKRCSLQ